MATNRARYSAKFQAVADGIAKAYDKGYEKPFDLASYVLVELHQQGYKIVRIPKVKEVQ